MKKPDFKAELIRLARRNGILTCKDVVAAARPKSSPLHSRFEWDDSKAADEYRLWQARELITLHVECTPTGDNEYQVFVSLSTDRKEKDGGYRLFVDVMSHPQQRAQLLNDALEEMDRFKQKYGQLKELAAIFAALKKIRSKRK